MLMKKRLFVDADAYVALHDRDDAHYLSGLSLISLATTSGFTLVTSDPAFGEAITVISQNVGHQNAIKFAEETLASPNEIVEVDAGLRRRALDIFSKQTSKNSRFTDCINVAIMEREGLEVIFSFDQHYIKNGFELFEVDE